MSVTQRQWIIICIQKEGKPKHLFKKWRPISLLNTAYKITGLQARSKDQEILEEGGGAGPSLMPRRDHE